MIVEPRFDDLVEAVDFVDFVDLMDLDEFKENWEVVNFSSSLSKPFSLAITLFPLKPTTTYLYSPEHDLPHLARPNRPYRCTLTTRTRWRRLIP